MGSNPTGCTNYLKVFNMKHTSSIFLVINGLAFYIYWWLCFFCAANQEFYYGPIVGIIYMIFHFLIIENKAKEFKYIIIVRGPISRAISAFYWRYKLVVQTGEQRNRFPGEFEILQKYQTLNRIAENLYDEKGHKKVAREMMAMTINANKTMKDLNFHEISCWVCHRGENHPLNPSKKKN